ncbi:hypothetical protein PHMEG_00033457 [Phytophthora megakarya]|uniref:Uncharacterized protein n=1 Tax=Phytophthora megakarya TaxID=4795 RepID=A0A225USZ4_9STRA|nr:hypothetical protein PHMEG_00033457 [Phytophthora megakarya]
MYYTQEHQLAQRRRVVMLEDVILADSPALEVVHHALTSVEARAQHRATEMEHQLNVFMNTTYERLTDVERKLQERLEASLQTTQSEVLATAADAIRGIHKKVVKFTFSSGLF